MTVEGWARREAEAFTGGPPSGVGFTSNEWDEATQMGYEESVATGVHTAKTLADRLLSDEAVEAAALGLQPRLYEFPYTNTDHARYQGYARAALQAAIDAVTREEDGNE